jgi:predicted nuclease of restriction endonuclease-like (RecB) superfamily
MEGKRRMKRKRTTNDKTLAIAKSNASIDANDAGVINEDALFERITSIIENRKARIESQVNAELTLMYWEIGQYTNSVILDGGRGEYGKKILATLSPKLIVRYGRGFEVTNIYRMMRFAAKFDNKEILATLSPKLSWSHIVELLPLKTQEARLYYAKDVAERKYGVRELRRQISRKAYERREIANTELSPQSAVPFNVFKDPYLLNILGLNENFLEADLEQAILSELEAFILEFGNGFTFVERQKRMTIDGDDIVLDLLFYNRALTRLVAVELKIGRFKAAFKGQMELYLKWLDMYERKPNEEAPIGIILCATANRKTVEMLEMDKAGIAVAEYWTALPPKALFEEKIRSILAEAQERMARRKYLTSGESQKHIDYFYDPKGDEDE